MNAIRQLLTEAVTVDNRPSQVYWFSRQSAYYLLAALELYAENYDKAEEYALKSCLQPMHTMSWPRTL